MKTAYHLSQEARAGIAEYSLPPVFQRFNAFFIECSHPQIVLHRRHVHKKVMIGNDVWIGDNVLIKGGVTIGDGAVIGMGSIVTKDGGPYTVVAGIPAKIIRYRFDEQTIARLQQSRWWEREMAEIRDLLKNK